MWSPDYLQRDILEVDIDGGDTSVVTFPANPGTTGTTSLRKQAARGLLRSGILDDARMDLRAGKTLSADTMNVLQQVLDLVAEADDAVDAAQPLLADLMGVPNPDADDSSSSQQTNSHTTDATTSGRSLALAKAIANA
jgi:hypothetical protein